MRRFTGFPARMEFTPVPNVFLSRVLPQMNDIAEIRVTLHLFAAIYRKRGHPRFVTRGELLGDAGLVAGLREEGQRPEDVLRRALDNAAERGTVIRLVLDANGGTEEVYFVNGEAERRAVSQIQNGELVLRGLKARGPAPTTVRRRAVESTPETWCSSTSAVVTTAITSISIGPSRSESRTRAGPS